MSKQAEGVMSRQKSEHSLGPSGGGQIICLPYDPKGRKAGGARLLGLTQAVKANYRPPELHQACSFSIHAFAKLLSCLTPYLLTAWTCRQSS